MTVPKRVSSFRGNIIQKKEADKMHHQPQGDSIWGNINTAIEIALNVYYIFAENGEGIMIPKDKAKDTVSERTAAAGQEDNGYLCYGKDNNMDLPMYELLQKRIAACEKIKAEALAQMQLLRQRGSLGAADYFGECEPPGKAPEGEAGQLQKIRNGIYFATVNDMAHFAVHTQIANNFLSPIAYEFGVKSGDYIYYDLRTCAIPLNELKNTYDEVQNLIVSEDSLNATLNKFFQVYVTLYNDMVQEESRIPPMEAPTALFLQRQLDATHEESAYEDYAPEHETDNFNEQVDDYGFEP